jgi:hypothetical protein
LGLNLSAEKNHPPDPIRQFGLHPEAASFAHIKGGGSGIGVRLAETWTSEDMAT